jgi:putative membrane protein
MSANPMLNVFLNTLIYTLFGVIVFGVSFWLMVKISPFPIRKELETDHNTAVAILMGSVILGLAIIIAAALHG